jgi:hypothetical protein
MPSLDDININRQVRTVLVKHWVDLGRLSVRTVKGRCAIRGAIVRLPGIRDELTAATVDSIFLDIRRICGTGNLRVDLDNWSNSSGFWKPIATGASPHSTPKAVSRSSSSRGGSFLISDSTGDAPKQENPHSPDSI